MSPVDEVSRHLRMKSIIIPTNNDWLTSCVECFTSQGNYTLKELSELVYQQWLLADLSDIGVQVLPDSCLSAGKIILQGKFAVQFNYFVNIAVSFHKQLQKIRKPESAKNSEVDYDNASSNNSREPVSNHRTLKIEITDGVLTIVGFEDQFIPHLHEPLVPGKKAILVGPLECRKGVMFLKPANVQILGGEVDALHIPNATENILARALKLPENPDPYHLGTLKEENTQLVDSNIKGNDGFDDDEEAMMMLAEVIENEVTTDSDVKTSNVNLRQNALQKTTVTQKESGQRNTPYDDSLIEDDFDDDMAELEEKINFKTNTESIEFNDDFESIEETTFKGNASNSKPNLIENSTKSFPECQIFSAVASKKQYEQITELKNKLKESYGSKELSPSTSFNTPVSGQSRINSLGKDKIIFDYLSDGESPLTRLTDEPESIDISSSKSSEDVSEINLLRSDPFPPQKRPALVKVPARVVKVLKKPKLKGDKWSVSALVMARGMELEVTFESEVIDKIFTISAAEIVARRNELISDPSLKQKINETLKNSQMRFSTLSCVMVFSFPDSISKPIIVDVE